MRNMSPLALFAILMVTSLSPFAFGPALEHNTTREVSPRALIDFEVSDIELGNGTLEAREWLNPDGSIVQYVMRDELIQINVTFTQAGTSGQPASAIGIMQIWHPVGVMVAEWSVNMTLSGAQSFRAEFYWTPTAAQSYLDDDGYLLGGIILRGIVDGGLADDNSNNNQYDRLMPVAIWNDPMENGICGDVDGDGTIDCPNQLSYNNPTWVGAGYDADGSISGDPDYYGHWRMENASSAVGEKHWRVSRPGADYASNRQDRLWWGWLTPFDSCEDPGHGLGSGTYDPTVSTIYANYFCRARIRGFDYLNLQLVTNAWGSMGQGDTVRLEADAGNEEFFNYSAMPLSTTFGNWTQLVWNMTDVHPNGDYTVAFRFDSDSSVATQGIHLDGFILFGIERVPEYTLDVECNDPLPNAYIVIPADPTPPTLGCTVKNNGYVDITLRVYTEVSNKSWMWDFPLRIESNHPNDFDNNVVTKNIKPLETMDLWVNLTIPDGATVQEVDWYVHIGDGITNFSKWSINLPVDVTASYSSYLTQKTLENPAITLLPGETGDVVMTLKNTGNQRAIWNLGGTFADNRWSASNLVWTNETGVEITSVEMDLNEKFDLHARITSPDEITPGTYAITLIASGRAPANFQTEWTIHVEVPIDHDLKLVPQIREMMAPADGALRWIEIQLVNDGNSEEAFDLSIAADWRLGLEMNAEQTLGIDPFGGDTSVLLMFPMPYGIENETYQIWVHATSQINPDYQRSVQLLLTVPETYLIEIPDLDLTNEVYRAGDDARTMRWEVWNNGNMPDKFDISFDKSHEDITVFATGLNNGKTDWIQPGSSVNLTVSYAFSQGADGDRTVTLIAESQQAGTVGQTVAAEGEADFKVGQVGWLLVTPPAGIVIEDKGEVSLEFVVTNLNPSSEQLMRADIDRISEPNLFFNVEDVRVDSEDRDFVLPANATKIVTVTVDLNQENLDNLAENTMTFNVILTIDSDIDKVSASTTIRLVKTVQVEDGPDVGFMAKLAANIVFVIAGLVAMIVVSVITFRVVKEARAPLEEYSSIEDYSPSFVNLGGDNSVPAAPDLPAADEVANSMYGGSAEIFENPAAEMPPPPLPSDQEPTSSESLESEEEESEDDESSQEAELPPGVPPIPEEGLPQGWTMEQWAYYGEKWLEQNKGE